MFLEGKSNGRTTADVGEAPGITSPQFDSSRIRPNAVAERRDAS
jgi:hypothetical protein